MMGEERSGRKSKRVARPLALLGPLARPSPLLSLTTKTKCNTKQKKSVHYSYI